MQAWWSRTVMSVVSSRSIRNQRRIRFGFNSRACLAAVPTVFVMAFVPMVVVAELDVSSAVELVVGGVCGAISVWCSWLVLRLWFRLYVRLDFPTLEIGQATGPVFFDLRDTEVGIEITAGMMVVSDSSDGRRVRAWGADGQQRNANFLGSGYSARIAWELHELLRDQAGASLSVADRVPSVPLSERFEILSWSEYRDPPNQR